MAERPNVTTENLIFLKEPEVRGVSKQLVASLWDIVNKRGQVDPNRGITEFYYRVPNTGITVLITTSTGHGGLIVQRDRQIQIDDLAILETNLIPKIGWDRRLSARDAKVAVVEIDKELRVNGQIDNDGARLPLTPEQSLKGSKISVSEVLNESNEIFATQAATKETALLNFDRPELVEVVSFENGIALVRLRAR